MIFKRFILVSLILCITVLSACTNKEGSQNFETAANTANQLEKVDSTAQIIKVYTDLEKDANWWVVPKDASSMTIYAEVSNVETLLFWRVPTGTEAWSERSLIGYDIDGQDGWSLTWNFDKQTLHERIYIEALGSDGSSMDNETIGITSEIKTP